MVRTFMLRPGQKYFNLYPNAGIYLFQSNDLSQWKFYVEESLHVKVQSWWSHDDLLWENVMGKPQGAAIAGPRSNDIPKLVIVVSAHTLTDYGWNNNLFMVTESFENR